MYQITKDGDGVVLVCHDCSHVERINSFDEKLGSRRTQAARAKPFMRQARQRIGAQNPFEELRSNEAVVTMQVKVRQFRGDSSASGIARSRLRYSSDTGDDNPKTK
jgi:hypothetical protein